MSTLSLMLVALLRSLEGLPL
uniref:Uncharacterized protein n=1 Tax=Arundo donax TaxID=35708 RepID=A0A0A9CGH2_ARUDO